RRRVAARANRLRKLVRPDDDRHVGDHLRGGAIDHLGRIEAERDGIRIERLKEIPPGGIHRVGIDPEPFEEVENVPRVGAVECSEICRFGHEWVLAYVTDGLSADEMHYTNAPPG